MRLSPKGGMPHQRLVRLAAPVSESLAPAAYRHTWRLLRPHLIAPGTLTRRSDATTTGSLRRTEPPTTTRAVRILCEVETAGIEPTLVPAVSCRRLDNTQTSGVGGKLCI